MSRIERLAARLEEPLLVAGPPYVLGGQANVRYLTGLASSNAAVLVEPDGAATLFTDFRYATQAPQEAVGIDVQIDPSSIWDRLGRVLLQWNVERLKLQPAKGMTRGVEGK